MIDQLILKKADCISYNKDDISKIKNSSNHIKKNIEGKNNFGSSFIGGSFLRETIVKNISDIDLYFEYKGKKKPKIAVEELNSYLKKQYPDITIIKEMTSVELKLNELPFSITPFLTLSDNIAIPDNDLKHWEIHRENDLQRKILELKKKNKNFIKLIKIIKLWNKNHNHLLKSIEIEKKVVKLFLYSDTKNNSISEWLWTFFIVNGYDKDARKIEVFKKQHFIDSQLEEEWLKFIENC